MAVGRITLLESEDDFFGLRFKSYVIKWLSQDKSHYIYLFLILGNF